MCTREHTHVYTCNTHMCTNEHTYMRMRSGPTRVRLITCMCSPGTQTRVRWEHTCAHVNTIVYTWNTHMRTREHAYMCMRSTSSDNTHVFSWNTYTCPVRTYMCAHVNTQLCTRGTRICVHVNTHTHICTPGTRTHTHTHTHTRVRLITNTCFRKTNTCPVGTHMCAHVYTTHMRTREHTYMCMRRTHVSSSDNKHVFSWNTYTCRWNAHVCTREHTNVYTWNTHTCTCEHTYVYTWKHICVHASTRKQTHTHTHTHACSSDNKHVFLEHKHVSSWNAHVCTREHTKVFPFTCTHTSWNRHLSSRATLVFNQNNLLC